MTAPVHGVVLDTDVASEAFKGKPLPILVKLVGWDPRNRAALDHWLSAIPILHSTDAIARTWGRLSAEAALRGRPGRRTTCGQPPCA